MSLAATAIDQPKPRDKVIETLIRYLDTDAVCCREEPGKLADCQAQVGDSQCRLCCHKAFVRLTVLMCAVISASDLYATEGHAPPPMKHFCVHVHSRHGFCDKQLVLSNKAFSLYSVAS